MRRGGGLTQVISCKFHVKSLGPSTSDLPPRMHHSLCTFTGLRQTSLSSYTLDPQVEHLFEHVCRSNIVPEDQGSTFFYVYNFHLLANCCRNSISELSVTSWITTSGDCYDGVSLDDSVCVYIPEQPTYLTKLPSRKGSLSFLKQDFPS